MSYDSSDDFYHLTPDGWLTKNEEPFPRDRVETWERRMRQSSGWSREDVWWQCVWVEPNTDRAIRDKLREKYPVPANRHIGSRDDVGKPL
ncbi:MAG: hypothetical protein ABSC63_02370 [Candidatus Binataceae bacterium]|jgi:hypothetical protein